MERAASQFFTYGGQYYVTGRYAAFAGLTPVVGNILHHAIEMFLKGALCKSKTIDEMRIKLRHDLVKIWKAFKAQENDTALAVFDEAIAQLHRFEVIRYPPQGMVLRMYILKTDAEYSFVTANDIPLPPDYRLCLEEVDELVALLLARTDQNPRHYFQAMMPREDARTYLLRRNEHLKFGP